MDLLLPEPGRESNAFADLTLVARLAASDCACKRSRRRLAVKRITQQTTTVDQPLESLSMDSTLVLPEGSRWLVTLPRL